MQGQGSEPKQRGTCACGQVPVQQQHETLNFVERHSDQSLTSRCARVFVISRRGRRRRGRGRGTKGEMQRASGSQARPGHTRLG